MTRSVRHPFPFFVGLVCLVAQAAAQAAPPLYDEAARILASTRVSSYTHKTHVDERRGIYHFDCSGLVDYALGRVEPASYRDLVAGVAELGPAPKRPLAKHFVRYFAAVEEREIATRHWIAVKKARHLKPGDVLAWLMPADIESTNTGHVMIVRHAPRPSPFSGELLVDVFDSTSSGHGSTDPRKKNGPNGMGSGTIGLVLDGDGRAIGYRWAGSESTGWHETTVRAGRPRP